MFCEKCGTHLPDDAGFCSNCGNNIGETQTTKTNEKIEDNQVQLRVKPTLKFGYKVLPSIIMSILFILLFIFPFFIIEPLIGFIALIISIVVLVFLIVIETLIKMKEFNSYTYDFYKTKVIYRDSFLNVSEKEVKYKHIREIIMSQSFIQRFFNIGTVVLYTNADTVNGNGIYIHNLENVQEVYKNIKVIVDV